MAETTADVKRDIELTRDRISNTLNQLEQKVHLTQIIKDNPWPAIGLAVGAGFLLSGSHVDVRAAASTVAATQGASSKLGTVLDDLVANLMGGLSAAFEQRVESLVGELKHAIGAPAGGGGASAAPSAPASAGRSDVVSSGMSQSGAAAGGLAVSSAGSQSMHDAASPSSASAGSFGASSSVAGSSSTSAAGYQPRAD